MSFCHSPRNYVLEVDSIRWSKITREKEISKATSKGQKKKRQYEESFIKNKRPLNPTHICLKKEKQLKIRTTNKTILMSQFNDDEERNTQQKRQRRYENVVMKGNIDPQQVAELLRK